MTRENLNLFIGSALGLCVGLIVCGTGHAQTATEIMPGVTYYGGADGGSIGVELIPGYRQYRGEIEGSSVETMPGARYYNVRPSDPYRDRQDRGMAQFLDSLYRQQDASDRALDKALGRRDDYRK